MQNEEQTPPGAKKPAWLAVIRWGGTLLSVFLLIYLLRQQGWEDLVGAVRQVPWWTFLLTVVFIFFSRVAIIGRWYVLLRSARVPITIPQAVRLVFAGLFANNFLPSTVGGDIVRFAGAVRLKLDAPISAASLVMDRLVGSLGMLTVLPIGLVRFASLSSAEAWFTFPPLLGITLTGLWEKASTYAKKALRSVLEAGLLWVKQPRAIFIALLWSWMHMFWLFATIWLLLNSMGDPLSFWLIAGLYSMSYFITLLPVSVNGLGLQELSLTFLFSRYGGVSMHTVLALAILIRVLFMIASLPGAFFLPDLVHAPKAEVKVE